MVLVMVIEEAVEIMMDNMIKDANMVVTVAGTVGMGVSVTITEAEIVDMMLQYVNRLRGLRL